MLLKNLEKKKVLILGFRREGQDTFRFLRKQFPGKMIGVADQLPFDRFPAQAQKLLAFVLQGRLNPTRLHFGKDYLKALKEYEIIIKSPGIPLKLLAPYQKKRQRVTSQAEIFFENCPGTVVGVTGTKGKSTTASLMYEVLKQGKVKVHLVGNIETPVLQFLAKATEEDVFVYELSSFQLETIKKSPAIAVLLNIYPEHLDYHGSLRNYIKAKEHITKFQDKNDILIFNEQDPRVREIAKRSHARKIPFQPRKRLTRNTVFIASVEPAVIVGGLFDVSKTNIAKAIRRFKPLPHRLEFVGRQKGIAFYNDSLSTIPEATIAAMDVFGPRLATLIVGGFDRGVDYQTLAKRILKSDLQTLILFPTTGQKIWDSIAKFNDRDSKTPQHFFVADMKRAVELCYAHTPRGKACLLSPAAASFNLFKDYKDRGEQFKKFVFKLARSTRHTL